MAKNNITELVFILDKSGSMSGLEEDTIGGFNSMIEQQKKEDGTVYVTTVLFSTEQTKIHDRADIRTIEPMTDKDYRVGGCTALIDAMGDTIRHIVGIHRYIRPEDVPEHTIFIITTDGLENASHRYTADKVRKMVKHEQEKYGWEFMFLGANIDAVETAARYGIRADRSANYYASEEGTEKLYACCSANISRFRSNEELEDNWGDCLMVDDNKPDPTARPRHRRHINF